MAVYTEVTDEELRAFLETYDVGSLMSYRGIAEGVENSNFMLHTDKGAYILTLYEKRVAEDELPFFLGLMNHLASRGIECPTPVRNRAALLIVGDDLVKKAVTRRLVSGGIEQNWELAVEEKSRA